MVELQRAPRPREHAAVTGYRWPAGLPARPRMTAQESMTQLSVSRVSRVIAAAESSSPGSGYDAAMRGLRGRPKVVGKLSREAMNEC